MTNKLNNGGMWYCPMCDTQSLDKWVCQCPKHTPKMSIYDAVVKVEPAQTKVEYDPTFKELGDKIKDEQTKVDIVGMLTYEQAEEYKRRKLIADLEEAEKNIWNAAIEAAAVEVNKYFLIEDVKEIAEQIRKLKK